MTWFWMISFWSRHPNGGWVHTDDTPFFRGDVQKAQIEHWNAYEESGADATTLSWWSKNGWVKFEENPG